MKSLIFRFVIPITLISFGVVTKWWYGYAIDAKEVFSYGFPLIYKSEGFHTSGSEQYFILELLGNLITYFFIWLIITIIIKKFWEIKIPNRISNIFWIGFSVFIIAFTFITIDLEDVYFSKRKFKYKIYDSGISIFEQTPSRENYLKLKKQDE